MQVSQPFRTQEISGRILGGVELHDALVRGGGGPGEEALFLQRGGLPGHVALVDADALGQLILGNAGIGADLRQVTGMACFKPHGRKLIQPILSAATGKFGDIPDDL